MDKVPSGREPPPRPLQLSQSRVDRPPRLFQTMSRSQNRQMEFVNKELRRVVSATRSLLAMQKNPSRKLLGMEIVGQRDPIGAKEKVSVHNAICLPPAYSYGKSESEHEIGSPTKMIPNKPDPTQPSPITPTPQEPTPIRPSTRKSGRPARRGRVGRNQYTKDRDVNGTGAESPRRGQSHDIGVESPRMGYSSVNGTHLDSGDTGRPSKPRHIHPQRTTMNEMKRRVAAILEFISRMQVEMAVASENSSTPTSNGDRTQGLLLKSMVDQIDNAMTSTTSEGGESGPAPTEGDGEAQEKEKDFKDLSSVEMMDVLTRHLLKWQQEYGKFGER